MKSYCHHLGLTTTTFFNKNIESIFEIGAEMRGSRKARCNAEFLVKERAFRSLNNPETYYTHHIVVIHSIRDDEKRR
jgi:hypothetical protein